MRPSISMTGTCASASFAEMVFFSSSIIPSRRRGGALSTRCPQRLVGLRLEVLERQLLELVLDLAHPEPVGDRRVDVARLLRDLDAALLGQVVQRPHVVEPVGELHEDDADVVHHRQQHLAEVLRLPLLARRERDRAELRHPFDDVRDVGAEELLDPLDRRLGVLDDVVEQAGGDGDDVQLHVGEQVGDLERVDEVGLAGVAHLSLVLEGREDVGPPQQLDVGVRVVGPDLFDEVLEPDHDRRCLTDRGDGTPVVSAGRAPSPVDARVFRFTILTRFGRQSSVREHSTILIRAVERRSLVAAARGASMTMRFRAASVAVSRWSSG